MPEILGSITGMNRRPTKRVKAARAAAKFPEEDSITVVSSQISPRSAARVSLCERRSLFGPRHVHLLRQGGRAGFGDLVCSSTDSRRNAIGPGANTSALVARTADLVAGDGVVRRGRTEGAANRQYDCAGRLLDRELGTGELDIRDRLSPIGVRAPGRAWNGRDRPLRGDVEWRIAVLDLAGWYRLGSCQGHLGGILSGSFVASLVRTSCCWSASGAQSDEDVRVSKAGEFSGGRESETIIGEGRLPVISLQVHTCRKGGRCDHAKKQNDGRNPRVLLHVRSSSGRVLTHRRTLQTAVDP